MDLSFTSVVLTICSSLRKNFDQYTKEFVDVTQVATVGMLELALGTPLPQCIAVYDFAYREKREINSLPFTRTIDNIVMVNEIMTEGNVSLVPWLVDEEWKKMKDLKSKYVFGHFELPNFYMNAMVQMPDHGELKRESFDHIDHVFSGHFHKRQTQNKIVLTNTWE